MTTDELTLSPPTRDEIRAVVERSRAGTSSGEALVAALVAAVEELLDALADRDGDALDRHRRTTEAIAALGEMGVRLPQAMVDRITRSPRN